MDELLKQFTVQRRLYDDPLYCDGNKLCQSVLGKQAVVLIDEEEFLHKEIQKFTCHTPGCQKTFLSLLDFEAHYSTAHRFVCETCHKRMPSSHLLDLHVAENHDSFFAALAERKPMFQCFLETCTLRFTSQKERKSHCIEQHKFPSDFRYDPERTAGKPKKKEQPQDHKSGTKLLGFGHNQSRSFSRNKSFGGHWHNKSTKQQSAPKEVEMRDLEEALPKVDVDEGHQM